MTKRPPAGGRTVEVPWDREFIRDEFLTLVYIYIYIRFPSDIGAEIFLPYKS